MTDQPQVLRWPPNSEGDLIIQAGNHRIQLDRGVLYDHCPTLAETLLSLALRAPGEPGTKIAKTDLDGDDLSLVIPFMYGEYMGQVTFAPRILLALQRIHSRYPFLHIFSAFTQQMDAAFPTTFDAWRKVYFDGDHPWRQLAISHEFKLLAMVHQSGVKRHLPAAYLLCLARRSLHDITIGRDEPNGPVYLSPELKHTLVEAYDLVAKKATEHIYEFWLSDEHPRSGCGNKCDPTITRTLKALADGSLRAMDALFERDNNWPAYPGHPQGLCRWCGLAEGERRIKGMKPFFEGLPTYFGMGSWADVVKVDAAS